MIAEHAPKAHDFTNERAHSGRALTDAQRLKNRRKSAVRAAVEHPFLQIKRLWGYAKTRYRGLAKNTNRLVLMCAVQYPPLRKTTDGIGASAAREKCAARLINPGIR